MKADTAAGLALTALGLAMAAGAPDAPLALLAMPAVTLPVIWRRRAPLAAAAVLSAGVVASAGAGRCGAAIPAALLVLYALGSRADTRRALAGLALVLAAMTFLSLTDPIIDAAVLSFVIPLCLATTGIGRAVRARARLAADLDVRTRELERQRERTAELAIAVERTRLAAQLDATARDRLREMIALAERVADFARIERLGRDSLNDMRALLGLLRSDGRAPQPTLAQLGALLNAARERGRAVALDVEGEERPLPGGVEVTAYRIVEHALDGDAPLAVRLSYRADMLELELSGATDRALAAARERVRAHGGRLTQHHGVVKAQLHV
jgi:hypothetical protein